jgi:DNA-binding NarL/FixJ family response regulator
MISPGCDVVPFPRSVMAIHQAFSAPFPGITVLLIDPSEDDRNYYAEGLRACSTDYLVLEASDGRTGLDLYRTHRIDCIILELVLPDVNAVKVLATVVPRVAVVALSRWNSKMLSEIALQYGAQACLIKSQTAGEVLDHVIQKAVSAMSPKPEIQARP